MSDNHTAKEWATNAKSLADWTWRHLVNRIDAWGGYWRTETEEGPKTQLTTRPHPRDRGKIYLSEQILANHFAATDIRFVIGLHSTSPGNTSRWGAVDVDWHGERSTAPQVNLSAALHWYSRLQALGFRALLEDSNGAGGYHLLVVFHEPVATAKVFAFMQWLVGDHAIFGLPTSPETFPKQPRIKPGRYGNWLRSPGRHHTRTHWSRIWDGSSWLNGKEAVRFILALQGNDPGLIPVEALTPKVTVRLTVPTKRRVFVQRSGNYVAARIRAYLFKLPSGLGEGQHRDDFGYTFAAFLVRDLHLSDAEAMPWMEEWDARNAVPKGAACLEKLLASAHAYGRHPYGSGLRDSHTLAHIRCGARL
jgi:hypothetical protein